MCFWRLLSVFVVFLGMCGSVFAAETTQKSQAPKTDIAIAQASKGQTLKQTMSAHTEDLRTLMLALYELHPEELSKSAQISPREMTEWVFDGKFGWRFDGLRKLQDQQALDLLFDEQFKDDHVLALVVGLETSLFHGYGAENEFAIAAEQDASQMQRLACTLRDFQKRYQDLITGPKQVPMLQSAASQQLLFSTLESILQRIPSLPGQSCP